MRGGAGRGPSTIRAELRSALTLAVTLHGGGCLTCESLKIITIHPITGTNNPVVYRLAKEHDSRTGGQC